MTPHPSLAATKRPVLLFDGVCNVCDASVQFILRHEAAPDFVFLPLQDARAIALLAPYGLNPHDLDTVVVVDGAVAATRSDAAVAILKRLKQPWRMLGTLLRLVPSPLRNLGYDAFAAVRYRLFGKKDACMVPTPAQRARFLGTAS